MRSTSDQLRTARRPSYIVATSNPAHMRLEYGNAHTGADSAATDGSFDYESKVWGLNNVRLSPTYLNAMRLRHCLADLEGVSGRVLEVGCGGGGMARAIQSERADLQVSGCDVSVGALVMAHKATPGLTLSVADGIRLPFKRDSIDAVVMFDVLEHVRAPSELIVEISRVLKSDGVFHLFSPCEGSVFTLHGLLRKVGWRAKRTYAGHIQMFTQRELSHLLRNFGFQISELRWSGHLLNQLADICYFTLLSIRGTNSSMSVESYVASTKDPFGFLVGIVKSLIALLGYMESRVLWRFPGWGIHLRLVSAGNSREEIAT